MRCIPCVDKGTKAPNNKADFTATLGNVIIPLCADHAIAIIKKGGNVSPMPGTKDKGVDKR